jgi:hypothetical protein
MMAKKELDVARQSTLQETLNSCLGRIRRRYFYRRSIDASTTEPFAIEGKGKLFYASIYHNFPSGAANQLQLVVDGKTVINVVNGHSASSAGNTYLWLLNPAMNTLHSNGWYMDFGLVTPVTARLNNASYVDNVAVQRYIDERTALNEEVNASNAPVHLLVDGWIEFNSSLKVVMSGITGTASYVAMCYSLDDE